jgi:hypothetical protein
VLIAGVETDHQHKLDRCSQRLVSTVG